MGNSTKIQWADHTWNPWHGCKKVSSGCKFCYMFRDKEKYGQDGHKVSRSKTKFNDPLKWQEDSEGSGVRYGDRIFTCSWSDVFIEEADAWRGEFWDIIKKTPRFDYLILTKRPGKILRNLPADWGEFGYSNVVLGVSIESQEQLHRLKTLQSIKRVDSNFRTFISAEPLIGEIEITEVYKNDFAMLDWVIIGGESGNDTGKYRYRKCEMSWMTYLVEQCKASNVPVFVKQLGTHLAKQRNMKRHGGEFAEFPVYLQHREFYR